jgi:hypothetical protein
VELDCAAGAGGGGGLTGSVGIIGDVGLVSEVEAGIVVGFRYDQGCMRNMNAGSHRKIRPKVKRVARGIKMMRSVRERTFSNIVSGDTTML